MSSAKNVDGVRIVVLGSVNMDLVARCATLPVAGQTLIAQSFAEIPGGKGANQAVAARRAGAAVDMIGRVGDDGFAGLLRDNLRAEQINCDALRVTETTPSGVAMIADADSGENQIVVVPGANGCVTCQDVEASADQIGNADALLLQLEVPLEVILRAIQIGREVGTRVILDPAPAPSETPDSLFDVDLICPNATEAASLTGMTLDTPESIEQAARHMADSGSKAVAITLGPKGTAVLTDAQFTLVEAFPTEVVDTTAAGDAFAGALAVYWAETDSLLDAVRFGNAAGALAASRAGAQPGMAWRREINEVLTQRHN